MNVMPHRRSAQQAKFRMRARLTLPFAIRASNYVTSTAHAAWLQSIHAEQSRQTHRMSARCMAGIVEANPDGVEGPLFARTDRGGIQTYGRR